MKTAVIVVTYFTPRWCRLTLESAHELEAEGHRVSLFDLSRFQFPRASSAFARAYFKRHGRELLLPSRSSFTSLRPGQRGSPRESLNSELFFSQAFSYFKDTNLSSLAPKIFIAIGKRRLRKLLETDFWSSLQRFDTVVVQNGRYAVPSAILAASKQSQKTIFYLETGLPNNPGIDRYYFEKYSIHDRESRQAAILGSEPNSELVASVAKNWLVERTKPQSNLNVFSRGWNFDAGPDFTVGNLFLTSSTDEFWALGPSWREATWKDQYEAFDFVISALEELEERDFTLRVHPNLLNKSRRFIEAEVERIKWLASRHPGLNVFYPHHAINTYSLIARAKRVVVSRSTAGLEASALGKPVWCTVSTNYDLVADVRRLLFPESVTKENLGLWQVSPERAFRFIAWVGMEGKEYKVTSRVKVDLRVKIQTFPRHDWWFRGPHLFRLRILRFLGARFFSLYDK